MTVKELIEALEQLPEDYPVVAEGIEITDVVIREEVYYTEDYAYSERCIVKLS